MPSQQHELLIELFRHRPSLAVDLLREALHIRLPPHSQVRVESASLPDIQPTEYRADLVVLLTNDAPVLGIVVEVQLSRDDRKPFVWPVYATTLRARFECPVRLLIVALTETVATWAATSIDLDGSNEYRPLVLGSSVVPEIMDEDQACSDPELAVLSAIAHAKDSNTQKSAQIALIAKRASRQLDEDRSQLYIDLVLSALSHAARQELQKMDPATYEYQSEFARRCVARGRAEGRYDLLIRQLTLRFGTLSTAQQTRIRKASIAELNAIGERLLSASTLRQALGARKQRTIPTRLTR